MDARVFRQLDKHVPRDAEWQEQLGVHVHQMMAYAGGKKLVTQIDQVHQVDDDQQRVPREHIGSANVAHGPEDEHHVTEAQQQSGHQDAAAERVRHEERCGVE